MKHNPYTHSDGTIITALQNNLYMIKGGITANQEKVYQYDPHTNSVLNMEDSNGVCISPIEKSLVENYITEFHIKNNW
ncbi:hypothetical protein [Vibrio mediterranei]|uniref:Uncharacterized protein n=1 Tax=Vibrio mediterranei TaxID=689 RepID=A0ABX5D6D2_9VIBR|nr:hypothetical protein [Vibrio mediterranei]PRQ65152.1 hypothetical protein COR51_23820 [Vibrio mediterranei]